jgi:hypothetical protein
MGVSLQVTGRREFVELNGACYNPEGHLGRRGDPRLLLLTAQLAALVAGVRLAGARQAIAAGRALLFGKIALTADGVRWTDGTVISWAEISEVDYMKSWVVVRGPAAQGRRSYLVRERIAQIPDFGLFKAMFSELRKKR